MQAHVFTARLKADDKTHRDIIETASALTERFQARLGEIKADSRYTAEGRKSEARELLSGGIGEHLNQLKATVENEAGVLAAHRAQLVLPPIDKTDVLGEIQRAEVRTWLRSLPESERLTAALSTEDKSIRDAIINAPAPLSGLNADIYNKVKANAIEVLHGPKMAASDVAGETLSLVKAAIQVANNEMIRMVEDI